MSKGKDKYEELRSPAPVDDIVHLAMLYGALELLKNTGKCKDYKKEIHERDITPRIWGLSFAIVGEEMHREMKCEDIIKAVDKLFKKFVRYKKDKLRERNERRDK